MIPALLFAAFILMMLVGVPIGAALGLAGAVAIGLANAEAPVIKPGFQKATVHGARLFVLPNPSGRNAHFSYEDMLTSFRALGRAIRRVYKRGRPQCRRRNGDCPWH